MDRRHKRFLSLLLAALIVHSAAFAEEDCFSFCESSYDLLESYCAAYGWDREMFTSREWTGRDGEPCERTLAYQTDYYADLYESAEELASQLGILPQAYGIGGNMAETALKEVGVTESPRGSNRVKYNTWFYGSEVMDPMENGSYRTRYAWCNVFLCWVANECGYLDMGLFLKTGSVRTEFFYLTQQKGCPCYPLKECTVYGGTAAASPGDIVVWHRDGVYSHIGIVTGIGDSYLQVTSGNLNDMVRTDTLTPAALSAVPELAEGFLISIHYPTVEETIFGFLMKELGLNTAAASGIMSNIFYESRYNPNALGDANFLKEDGTRAYGDNYAVGEGTSYGLCQWHTSNWDNLKRFCSQHGYDYHSLEGQLWFLKFTVVDGQRLTSEGRLLIDVLREIPDTAQGAYDAGYIFCTEYEHPDKMEYQGRRRGATARDSIYPVYA